jgi:hypothetical protein
MGYGSLRRARRRKSSTLWQASMAEGMSVSEPALALWDSTGTGAVDAAGNFPERLAVA